jgi:hypothetical protein
MLELALFALLLSRVYQICGHVHYFLNAPIRRGFQKTRAGHVVFTIYDGLTFVGDAVLVSANALFISLAVGHLAVAVLQMLAWNVYCQRFFDVLRARTYYSDGLHALRRGALLAYDLAGQAFSVLLLASALDIQLTVPAVALGVLGYTLFTADLRLLSGLGGEL